MSKFSFDLHLAENPDSHRKFISKCNRFEWHALQSHDTLDHDWSTKMKRDSYETISELNYYRL